MSRSQAFLRPLIALAAAASAETVARAQEVPDIISPLRVESDQNGVNLINGRTEIQPPVLEVPGAPNLRFDRIQDAAPYVNGRIETATPEGGLSTASFSVHTGRGASEAFRCVDFDCTSVTGTGSTFVQGFRSFRQAGTGAVWRFNVKHVDTIGTTPRTQLYYASSITYPNGEVISYTYETATLPGDPFNRTFYRPTRIESNLGFFITIDYVGDTLGTMEWNSPREAAIYNSVAPTTPLGRLTYNGDTITDLGGRTYTCTGCNNALGLDVDTSAGSLQLPGETTPTYQANAVPGADVVGSVIRDGVSWNYSYTNLRHDVITGGY